MEHLNRSDRSDLFQDRELIEAVLQKADDNARLNESVGSRLSSVILPQPACSLRSTGTFSRPPSVVSKQSVTSHHSITSRMSRSQENLSDVGHEFLDKADTTLHYEQLKMGILVLALICVCSIVLGSLALQLTIELPYDEKTTEPTASSLIRSWETRASVTEVAVALCTFVVALNACCLLVCSTQCLIVVKIIKLHLGDERAMKFLRDCSSSRFIAVKGFFVSIPVFLVACILYLVLRASSPAAITGTVIMSVGCIFCVVAIIQNVYHWRLESSRALAALPVYDCSTPLDNRTGAARNKELSTLV